jgi:ATP-dependent protease ClpP protease subunit
MRDILTDLNLFGIDEKRREIFVHRGTDDGEESLDVNHKMSSTFIKNLRLLDHTKGDILIHLNANRGGEWEDGIAMFDAIKHAKSYITVLIYGSACSMGSLIPQAADFRVIMPNAYMMCHYGEEGMNDIHTNNVKYFEIAKKMADKMVNIYSSKVSESEYVKSRKLRYPERFAKSLVKKKLDEGNWYLTSDEALHYGLVDAILGTELYPNIDFIHREFK